MKEQKKNYWKRMLALLVLLGLLSVTGTVLASDWAGDIFPDAQYVYPRDSVIFGWTYSEWSAAWQQWANSIPVSEHPLFDNAPCSKGQSGPVWFLGGKFCSSENPNCPPGYAVRSCTVPKGKALYFPIVNFACLDGEAKIGACGTAGPFITQMRTFLGGEIDQTTNIEVTLDGKPIKGDLKKNFRVQSPVYTTSIPNGNLFQEIGEDIGAGTYWGVDDGVYIMLHPLRWGTHTLKFKGTFPQYNFTIDVTYDLIVQ